MFEDLEEHSDESEGEGNKNEPEKKSKAKGEEEPARKRKVKNEEIGQESKKPRIRNILRQPTNEELTQLRETENLFNSNLFRMQIDEVLEEVKIKPKTVTRFQKWLERLNNALSIIKLECAVDLDDKSALKTLGAKLPFSSKYEASNSVLKEVKLSEAKVIGSYKFGCAINAKLIVDISVMMDSSMFSKNDSINYRYHKKKAACYAIIASQIQQQGLSDDLKYAFLNGNELLTVLQIKPEGKLGNNALVNLHLQISDSIFKLSRLDLSRNNVRECWFFHKDNSGDEQIGPPTPMYNSSILHDVTQNINMKKLTDILTDNENLKAAAILLKIWLRQRCLDVPGHIITMLVAYLFQERRINNIMSSYQIVRNVWIALSTSMWDTKGITLAPKTATAPALEEFLKVFPVVFLDCTGFYNLCATMSLGTYETLKSESSMALTMLDNADINSFLPLFMTPFKLEMQFDEVFSFKKPVETIEKIYKTKTTDAEKLDYGPNHRQLVVNKITDILKRGLRDRANLILENKPIEKCWSVNMSYDKAMKKLNDADLCFGLILDQMAALAVVDKGPEANLPEALEFRNFWGAKSELRRFQDGSITEACLWNGETLAEKRTIVKQIVEYLFQSKFDVKDELFYPVDTLDSVLLSKEYQTQNTTIGTGEELTVQILDAYNDIRTQLRNISEVPLTVNSVYGISPVFSYCDPLPPFAQPSPPHYQHETKDKCCLIKTSNNGTIEMPRFVKSAHVILELGHSGKWPGELEAFKRLKAAFCIQIAECLSKQFSLSCHVFSDCFVIYKDGFIFKMEIVHPKEILLTTRYKENGVVKYQDTDQTLNMKTKSAYLPRLRGNLHGLHQQYPSYGPTVCLAKRFLRSHLLDNHHIPDIVIELLVAYLYLRPQPYREPNQPLQGFRRFLNLMASADWSTECLVLKFNEEFSHEIQATVESKFNSERAQFPPLCIITAAEGEDYSVWSKSAPDLRTLALVKKLSQLALGKIHQELSVDKSAKLLSIFKPSLGHFDVLIRLDTSYVVHYGARLDVKPRMTVLEEPTKNDKLIPVFDFDPVQCYLDELRAAYDEFVLFFHDTYGGDVIGCLWKPSALGTKEFQVLRSFALKPKKKSNSFVVNFEAIIEDFKILGKDLVLNIEVVSKLPK